MLPLHLASSYGEFTPWTFNDELHVYMYVIFVGVVILSLDSAALIISQQGVNLMWVHHDLLVTVAVFFMTENIFINMCNCKLE